jgi:hypothetical protein
VDSFFPNTSIQTQLLWDIPFLQVPFDSLLSCQVWPPSTSQHIIVLSYDASMHRCLWGSPVDMPKPSQPVFNKLFFSIGVTRIRLRMPSFLTRSNLVCPHIQRTIRISVTLSCWIFCLLVGQWTILFGSSLSPHPSLDHRPCRLHSPSHRDPITPLPISLTRVAAADPFPHLPPLGS